MLTVTARFLSAIRETHTVSVAATLYRPSAPSTPIAANVLGGQLTADLDARVRRQATLEIAFALTDPVTADVIRELPFGGTATIHRGITYADGSIERVQLGRFRVDAVTWPALQGQATLTLSDRMAQVQDESLTQPYVATGQKPSDAIVALIQAVFASSIAYHVSTTPATEATLTDAVYTNDRAAAVSDLAASITAGAYFDNLGDFVLAPKPTGTGPAVWTIDAGPTGVMVSETEALDRSSVRNGVAVTATPDPSLAPIYSLAVDSDPASPTRWGGPFGKVALLVDSTSIQTQAQADASAVSLLNLRLGLSRTLELHGIPNPALEPGDLISVLHPDGRSEVQYVNAISLGLGPDADLTITTRANWRPQPALLAGARVIAHSGPAALEQLVDATVVAA